MRRFLLAWWQPFALKQKGPSRGLGRESTSWLILRLQSSAQPGTAHPPWPPSVLRQTLASLGRQRLREEVHLGWSSSSITHQPCGLQRPLTFRCKPLVGPEQVPADPSPEAPCPLPTSGSAPGRVFRGVSYSPRQGGCLPSSNPDDSCWSSVTVETDSGRC